MNPDTTAAAHSPSFPWPGWALLAGLPASLLLAGCPRKALSPLENPRTSAQGTLELELTAAPDPWSFVEHGRMVIAGMITTQHGLDPEEPCTVTVKDIVTGFIRKVVIKPAANELHPHSTMPLEGGTFRIDIEKDFMIADDGAKLIAVEFLEQGGGTLAWQVPVKVDPCWPEVARTRIAGARRTYGVRLLPLLSQFRHFWNSCRSGARLLG